MISRYTRPEMGRIWSEENTFQKWLDVEILAAEGWAKLGKVPKAAIARIRRKARFDVKRIREIEAEGARGTIEYRENERDLAAEYEVRTHEKSPFGVVTAKFSIRGQNNPDAESAGTATLTLTETGDTALSDLPNQK